ncbi:MAG: Ig-like domain-containing protein, partial [bacterium]|nr:Ig-like domain-containing protein [bacterium]
IDGSITLPKGETITRKSGSSQVEIKAPADTDITMKPLPKPGADEIKDGNGEITPVGGLLLEVPTGSAITIGDKTYKETTIDNGRTGVDAYILPMQLVLDEKGNVVLHNGTAELGQGADISLYDVGNELANFKNTSAGDQKVQITNPGIATMPTSGASVTMGVGKNKVKFTTTEDETQIAYTPDVCLLKRGGVSLDPKEQILVGDMVVRNTSSEEVKVTREETLTNNEFTYTGKIEVPNGGSFELSAPGSDQAITYQSNVEGDGSAEFTINADGNLVLPKDGIAKLKDSTGKVTEVQAGVEGIESIPTPEGAIFAIPTGGAIVVDNVAYKNTSDSEYLVLSVNQDGKVVLVKGEVELSEGAIVYVKNEDEGLVPIKNNTKSSTSEGTNTQAGKICVTYDGVENQTDGNDQVVSTTYSDVNIHVPSGGSISIGKNNYQAVQTEADETDTMLSMSITAVNGSAVTDGNIPGDRIVLETGAVDLGKDSAITIHVPQNNPSATPKVLENIGGEDGNPILVGSDGKLELPSGSEIRVDDSTTIKVPAEGTDDYKAAVNLSENNGIVNIELQTETGSGKTGADKKVIINDNTYVSKENGKNLCLSIDTTKDDQVKLSGGSTSVGLSDGASITVGDTTVTATTDTEITVTETTPSGSSTKVPTVDIPAGGEANFYNPNKNQDIDVKVPEKSGEDDTQTNTQKFTIGTDGSISTDLKKDETVVIGGVKYTGTSESDDNTIKVNGTTGALEGYPDSAPPAAVIDPEQFNKTTYQYTIPAGERVTVNGVVYQAATGSSITLKGNPNGNPIVNLESADSVVIIDGIAYTAATANTCFVINPDGGISLLTNGNTQPATANSSLKLSGKDTKTVNGVTYSGSSETDSYTVTYHEDGSYVSVTDGSKLLMNMPAGSKIYVADKGAVETTNETGAAITATFNGVIPVTMNGGSGSIYLDKTKEGYTDTAFVQILGVKEIELAYDETGAQENKTITSITVKQKKVVAPPQTSGSTENSNGKAEQQISSIPVVGDVKESEVKIPVIVEKDKVILDTITTEVVEKLVNSNTEGTKVVSIDCTTVEKPIVVIDVPTVENMSQKADQIKIITASAEIEINKQAADAIIEQAVGSTIEIKVNSEDHTILNEVQKDTLKDYEVKTCLEAFVESAGTRIHNFKGGKVKVSIPWEIESGKKAVFYHVYYLDMDGVMHAYDTVYADGKLCFETDHFSEYAVVYDDMFLNATPVDDTPLLARVTKAEKTTLKLKWKPVEGAEKYTIYVAKCNTSKKTYRLKKVATVKASESTYVLKNLKSATKYKLLVKPISKDKKLKRSLTLRAVTDGGKYNNASDISLQQKKLTLKTGKTKRLKVRYTADGNSIKVGAPVQFVSSNKEIASVSSTGKIRAKRAGSCYIYAILTSGEYAAVKVTVK